MDKTLITDVEVVSLDTNILIWGLKREANPGQENLIPQAEKLINELEKNGSTVIITSQALAEFLVRYAAEQRQLAAAEVAKRFHIRNFDFDAAVVAADLYSNRVRTNPAAAVCKGPRHVVKADCVIIATSIAAKASTLYSNDSGFPALADGRIEIKRLSELA